MTQPVVVFPDVELLVTDHLRTELPTYYGAAQVGTRKPNPMPSGGVVQVRRTGGTTLTEVSDAALMDCWVWHDTDAQAAELAAIVRALLHALRGTAPVHRVADFAASHYADPDSDQPRYLLSVEIVVRGSALDPAGS